MALRRGAAGEEGRQLRSADVLAVFAHPDDESLLVGGTLAACASAGLEVAVASLTRGELGPGGEPAAGPDELGARREAELAAAARALGVQRAECLRYPDGELAHAPREELLGDLAARLEGTRPRAILTFAPEGLYWHEDHVATHELVLAAVDETGPVELEAPMVYGATLAAGAIEELVRAAAARGLPTDLWGLPASAFGAPLESITTTVDVRPFLQAKRAALRCHRSQLQSGHLLASLPADLVEAHLGREHFVRLRRAQRGEDWLREVVAAAARRVGG